MHKKDFVAALAAKAGLTKKDALSAVDAFTEVIKEELGKGERIVLLGLGTFSVVDKPERTGINPRTKEKITIKARKAVKFKAASNLSSK